jgi:xylulokinase
MVRSLMEGVCFALRDSLEIIKACGVPVRQIRASGGGSKSPFWRQLQADVLGQKVYSMVADEGPAYGVALLAAVGDGAYKSIEEACKATVETASETKPQSQSVQYYDRAFPIYQGLYRSLKEDFKKIAALQ